MDSQLSRPFETGEYIGNIKSAYWRGNEEERAEKAVESAKTAVISPQKATQRTLAADQSQLAAAIKSLELIKRRHYLVHESLKKTKLSQVVDRKLKRSYLTVKGDSKRCSILLRWILQHIPLIELDLTQANVAENKSGEENGRKKLQCNPTDQLNQD